MTSLCCNVLNTLKGKTLATAESCTGGMIGAALTAIPGSSEVYKGGVISYTNQVKEEVLGVSRVVLDHYGAVSAPVAEAMAAGVRKKLAVDVAISVTGLAGPGGDAFGNSVGTVYIGYANDAKAFSQMFHFEGNREEVRQQAAEKALKIVLENI